MSLKSIKTLILALREDNQAGVYVFDEAAVNITPVTTSLQDKVENAYTQWVLN